MGQGGQGTTYAARRDDDPGEYVLKILDHPDSDQAVARFGIEVGTARSLAASGCPGIVEIIDADLTPPAGTAPWFVMRQYEPIGRRGGPYAEAYAGDVDRVLELAAGIARALEFMHGAGAVHRDIKPANVFLDERRQPRLGDFGLAYQPTNDESVTATAERLGNYWRPPELLSGSEVQRHSGSDIYMLGGLIYELLSGGRTFEIAEQGGQYTHERPEYDLSRMGADPRLPYVNQMLRGMFRTDPNNRLSATAVRQLCERIREWRPGATPPVTTGGLDDAARAATEYLARSRRTRDAAVRAELVTVCERIAGRMQDRVDPQRQYLQVRIAANVGDNVFVEAARHADAVWAAVRVFVDFDPPGGARQYCAAYVFIGRMATGEEIIALQSSLGEWQEIARDAPGTPQHEDLMATAVADQVDATARHMAQIIDALEQPPAT